MEKLSIIIFTCSIVIFHASEYMMARYYHKEEASWHSWLISASYLLALSFCILEFFLESYLFPAWKQMAISWFWIAGLVLVVLGELIRKTAVITAGKSFNHEIQTVKREKHRLVVNGVYRFFRHPAYFGWFLWTIGNQLILANPLCTIAFIAISWNFLNKRIKSEEIYLVSFFGERYKEYKACTPTWLPFIK